MVCTPPLFSLPPLKFRIVHDGGYIEIGYVIGERSQIAGECRDELLRKVADGLINTFFLITHRLWVEYVLISDSFIGFQNRKKN